MKQIFTYPNNPSTYYVDPNYIGDDTTGFQGRVKDMIDAAIGGKYNWSGVAPAQGLPTTLTALGRYYNFYDSVEQRNISIWDMTRQPLVEFALVEKTTEALSLTHTMTAGPQLNISNNRWGISDGDNFQWTNAEINNTDAFNRDWGDIPYLLAARTADSGTTSTEVVFEYTNNLYYLTHKGIDGQGPAFMRHGTGSLVKTVASMDTMPTISRGFKKQSFTEPHDTGTLNTTTDLIYFKDEFTTDFTRVCYLDAACTVPATLDEAYYNSTTFVRTITAPAGGSSPSQISDWDITSLPLADQQAIQNGGSGWARITYENLTGADATFTPNVNCVDPIQQQSALDYLVSFYYPTPSGVAGTDLSVTMYDTRGVSGIISDFTLTSGAVEASSVDIRIEFINPARMQADDAMWTYYDQQDIGSDAELIKTSDLQTSVPPFVPYWGIDDLNSPVIIPGNNVFQYRDTNGDYQNGAEFSNDSWFPGDNYAFPFDTWNNMVQAPVMSPNLDGNGRSNGTITVTDAGRFVDNNFPHWILRVQSLPDQYVPPAPTPEEIASAEDNFDTLTQWDDYTGFAGGLKKWPLIPPKSARIDFKTPTLQTVSQSGIKYARHAGYTRFGLDVTYPPLNKSDMAQLQAASQLARGGAVTFDFDIDPANSGGETGFGFFRRLTGNNSVPVIKETRLSDNTYLVEGLESNLVNVTLPGQIIQNPDGGRNGNIFIALNTADANIFGETRIKFGFNDNSYNQGENLYGKRLWTHVDTLTVSLSEDNFQYVERGDGLYDCSVKFDLDFWK